MLLDSIEWLGHSGFRIDARGATIYIDPYRIAEGPPADLILVTHGHYDHYSPQDIERRPRRPHLAGGAAGGGRARRRAGRVDRARASSSSWSRCPGWRWRRVAAYNTSKRDAEGRLFHPREAGCVGFDLNVRGERLYHAGDTDVIPEMDAVVGVDVALLPVSGTYVMTAERGGRGRPADPAGRWRCRCTGASTSAPARTPRSSPSGRRWRCGSWSRRRVSAAASS